MSTETKEKLTLFVAHTMEELVEEGNLLSCWEVELYLLAIAGILVKGLLLYQCGILETSNFSYFETFGNGCS